MNLRYIILPFVFLFMAACNDVDWNKEPISKFNVGNSIWTLCKIDYDGLTTFKEETYTKKFVDKEYKFTGFVNDVTKSSWEGYSARLKACNKTSSNCNTIYVKFDNRDIAEALNVEDFLYVEAKLDYIKYDYVSTRATKIRKIDRSSDLDITCSSGTNE